MPLPGGRELAFDDVGDPGGAPVVYLHGTPDSRLARHPDDGLAAAAGMRLLAVDRPGYGRSSALAVGRAAGNGSGTGAGAGSDPSNEPGPTSTPDGTPGFAGNVEVLLDALGIERAAIVAWSGGALDGVAVAASPLLAGRVTALHVVAGLVPVEAYADLAVRAAGASRLGLLEMGEGLPPEVLAAEVAPMLAPYPCDRALALEHQREQRDPAEQARLASVPGGVERMADALAEAVSLGLAGVEADVAAQIRPLGVDLARVTAPVTLWYGTEDPVTPPAFGRWYATHLPTAALHLVDGAGHFLPFTHWPEILAALPPRR